MIPLVDFFIPIIIQMGEYLYLYNKLPEGAVEKRSEWGFGVFYNLSFGLELDLNMILMINRMVELREQ